MKKALMISGIPAILCCCFGWCVHFMINSFNSRLFGLINFCLPLGSRFQVHVNAHRLQKMFAAMRKRKVNFLVYWDLLTAKGLKNKSNLIDVNRMSEPRQLR